MKLIAKGSSRKSPSLYLLIITAVLIIAIPTWLRIQGGSTNDQLTESIQIAASELFEKDNAIAEFKIDSLELSHTNEASEEVYLLMFSIKPADPENFVLVGGGIEGEEGWIHERVNYVTVKNNNKLIFSTSP
ncbi:hypothetical protein MHB48_11845 [Psychrobacillus sp. FSL H8-0483]|uniref:hypothetical protein n=1 Tax=Psychrobacillus sp. FSL H8-0483 TaxID=2921389 RepID=UPI003159A7A8